MQNPVSGWERAGWPMIASVTSHNNGLLLHPLVIVDTGAEVSVVPATGLDSRKGQLGPLLLAANVSPIKTYGSWTPSLHFAFKTCQWNVELHRC